MSTILLGHSRPDDPKAKAHFMAAPDHQKAHNLLLQALKEHRTFRPSRLNQKHQDAIRAIIEGGHLTFRYILMTALLGKATEPNVHMRSLQAGAALTGAYDARSLCHKVWVPFEREHLDGRLGGSNEPFLNKPARFPAVDKSNAVRAGRDRDLLHLMYDLLESLNGAQSDVHREAFMYAFSLVMQRDGRTSAQVPLSPVALTADRILGFFDRYLASSCGGEVPVSIVGAILSLRFDEDDYDVRVHPANQAGTSSNEVGDIDVCLGDTVFLPVEVKDKPYSTADIKHAATKALAASCPRLLFVAGREANARQNVDTTKLVAEYADAGFDLAFLEVDKLVQTEVPLCAEPDRRRLVQLVNKCLADMRAKDETKVHFETTLKATGLTI